MTEPFDTLIEEHEQIAAAVASARAALEAAVQYPDDAALGPAAVEELHGLGAFMAQELALHIAKEEQVLFPAYRELAGDHRLIDELVVQHDRVRERDAMLRRALAQLDHTHEEVEAEQVTLAAQTQRAQAAISHEILAETLETVRRLDWILQGHFGDEEDDLFTPGEALFAPEALEAMHRAMSALGAPSA